MTRRRDGAPARLVRVLPVVLAWTGLVCGMLLAPGTVRAQTHDCATDRGCPKGSSPPDCCAPPPCELYEQIRMKRALQSILANRKLRKSILKRTRGDQRKAADELHAELEKRAKKIKLRCPWEGDLGPPPSFETDSGCYILALIGPVPEGDPKGQPAGESMGRERAFNTFRTCTEFIEAIYEHEGYHKERCFNMNSTERAQMGIHEWANEEVEGYRREIESLESDLKGYWNACSPVLDAKTRMKLARAKIIALKKARRK